MVYGKTLDVEQGGVEKTGVDVDVRYPDVDLTLMVIEFHMVMVMVTAVDEMLSSYPRVMFLCTLLATIQRETLTRGNLMNCPPDDLWRNKI